MRRFTDQDSYYSEEVGYLHRLEKEWRMTVPLQGSFHLHLFLLRSGGDELHSELIVNEGVAYFLIDESSVKMQAFRKYGFWGGCLELRNRHGEVEILSKVRNIYVSSTDLNTIDLDPIDREVQSYLDQFRSDFKIEVELALTDLNTIDLDPIDREVQSYLDQFRSDFKIEVELALLGPLIPPYQQGAGNEDGRVGSSHDPDRES